MEKNFIRQGLVFRCQDCRDPGYVIPHLFSLPEIPYGWRMNWVGLKPLLLCPDCVARRRKWARQFLSESNGNERRKP